MLESWLLPLLPVRGPCAIQNSSSAIAVKRRIQMCWCSKKGLHVEVVIDRNSAISKAAPAGISDMVLESALTIIQDCESSVAAVDAENKVVAYRYWLGPIRRYLA